MSQIKNIVFDFGGVLVDWNSRYYYRGYFNNGERMEYFLANVCNDEWNLENDRGRTYAEGVAELKPKHPEFSEAIEMFPLHWGEMLHSEKPESVALLRILKNEGYHLYGLTNWSAENIHVAYERFDFLSLFEGVVVSGIEKEVKPEPRIYHILLDRYNLKPEESIFIDDKEANIATARRLGMHGIVFKSAADTAHQINVLTGSTAQTKD